MASAACGAANPAESNLDITPITIESVDVLVMESLPPQVSAHVRGVVGDGCSEIHSQTQERIGNAVRVTILRARPRGAFCTQIARLYDQVIRLDGRYPAGRYTLSVNGVESVFTTP